jgi:hypothetical protein
MNWFKRAQVGNVGDIIFNQLYQAQNSPTSSTENLASRFVGEDPQSLQQGLMYAQAKLQQTNNGQPLNQAQMNIVSQIQAVISGGDPSSVQQQADQNQTQDQSQMQDSSMSMEQSSVSPVV